MVPDSLPNKSILITGIAGFLGRYVARHFSRQGWRVFGMDILPPENAPLELMEHYEHMTLPDLGLSKYLASYPPDVCVHCAGRAAVGFSVLDPASDFESSPHLVFHVLNTLRNNAPGCRFVLLSSAAVYGNPASLPVREDHPLSPISPYGYHKWQAELVCQEFSSIYDLHTASVRIFSAYGPGLRRQVVWDICQKALIQQQIVLQGTGKETRDFIYASDIATALELVCTQAPMQGEAYNLASGQQVSISELACKLLDALGVQREVIFDEKTPAGTPLNWQADTSRLTRMGFSPKVSLEHGLKVTARWCQAEASPYQDL